jgi:hypothetical protein
MKLTKREIKRYAKHEAGHAVYFVLNFSERFEFVWIRRSDDEVAPHVPGTTERAYKQGGAVFFKPNPTFYTNTQTLVANAMAGVAGERIARKLGGKFTFADYLSGAKGDYEEAKRHVEEHNEKKLGKFLIADLDKLLNVCLGIAWRTLKLYQPVHEEVARLLIERGTLTYDEVSEIVWGYVNRRAHE